MNIEQLINRGAERYSPYSNGLVNHLPMGQFALYSLTGDIEKAEEYTDYHLSRSDIDRVKKVDERVDSLETCLGKRDLYEPCLEFIREKTKDEDIERLVFLILNKYPLGLSSGLFHTTIRLAYAIEGYKIDKGLQKELERALAYYVTAYRQGGLFERKIRKDQVVDETNKLIEDPIIKKIRKSDMSLGKKLKSFYENEEFLKKGFIIEGDENHKVKGILEILIPAFYNSNNIVMLHTITGLQAVVTLKKYFKDYNRALDILTTTAIAHILTQDDLDIEKEDTSIDKTWMEVIKLVSTSRNVHTLKLAYTSKKLDDLFNVPELKYATYKRFINEKR